MQRSWHILLTWRCEPLLLDINRYADGETLDLNLDMHQIVDILEDGIEINKRKRGIVEKWCQRGKGIYIVTVGDYDDYWLIGHVGKIRATKDKSRTMIGKYDS